MDNTRCKIGVSQLRRRVEVIARDLGVNDVFPADVFLGDLSERFLCVKCGRVPVEANCLLDCGHRYCKSCMSSLFNEADCGQLALCVKSDCRKSFSRESVYVDTAFTKQLLRLPCKCPWKSCSFTGTLNDFWEKKHAAVCRDFIEARSLCSLNPAQHWFETHEDTCQLTNGPYVSGGQVKPSASAMLGGTSQHEDNLHSTNREDSEYSDPVDQPVLSPRRMSMNGYVWRIEHVDELVQWAQSAVGRAGSVCSPSFSIERGGDKMRLRLYPNGMGDSVGEFMAVTLIRHDSEMPFQRRIELRCCDLRRNVKIKLFNWI